MAKTANPSYETTLEVRDACLCLHVQRAARALARCFDDALRPVGLTNGQFSLMMSLNRPEPPAMAAVASLLGRAVPLWTASHVAVEALLPQGDPHRLRANLRALSRQP